MANNSLIILDRLVQPTKARPFSIPVSSVALKKTKIHKSGFIVSNPVPEILLYSFVSVLFNVKNRTKYDKAVCVTINYYVHKLYEKLGKLFIETRC